MITVRVISLSTVSEVVVGKEVCLEFELVVLSVLHRRKPVMP